MAPWNMNTANDTEKPVCMRISVMRLFSTLSRPPYTETNGTMSTWNGMTMEATISAKTAPPNLHEGLRTITYAHIAENRIVRMVALMVMIAELPNTVRKFIFSIALGKLSRVKPCLPIRASGSVLMSAFVLKTLITTRMNGAMNSSSTIVNTTTISACRTLVRVLT